MFMYSKLFRQRPARALTLLLFLFFSCLTLWISFHASADERRIKSAPPYRGPREAAIEEGQHGFLPLAEATAFCQRRRWEPYATRDSRRKVYDMFLISTELDFLEVRLHELKDDVDYFVILESATTFQMSPKPLHLQDNLARFSNFSHQIIHRVLDTSSARIATGDTWGHERFARNALLEQALLSLTGPEAPGPGDVLVVGDVDEILRAETVRALRNCAFPARVTLRSQMYYYSYQWLHRGLLWHHPQATYFAGAADTVRPETLRSGPAAAELGMAGWHCSSCFASMADLQTKITSFSHKVYNHPYILDRDRLLQKIRRGEDMFERIGEVYDRIDDNLDVPRYLRGEEARAKFKYMLDRDPPNANFQDVGL